MFKVILVDDEQWITDSIKLRIPWKEYGFEVCATASDGISALQQIALHHPDVIFCDIKMPCLNGLEVIAEAKKLFPELLSVIISGYSEFEYAKTAIKHGVDGYCVKPIEEDEIIEHLKNFRAKLEYQQSSENNAKLLECIVEDDITILKEFFPHSSTISIVISNGEKITELGAIPAVLFCKISLDKWVYFISGHINIEKIKGYVNEKTRGVGIYEMDMQNGNLAQGMEEANVRAYQYLFDKRQTVFAGDYNKDKLNRYNELLKELMHQVENKDISALNRSLAEITDLLGFINIAELRKFNNLFYTLKYLYIPENDQTWISQDSMLFNKWDNAENFVKKIGDEFKKMMYPEDASMAIYSGNKLITDVISYINENYKVSPLLTDLSSIFNVNATYLSKLFKKETGMTVLNYITQVKMQKACRLLLQTELSVNEAAQEAGYDDYLYFRKVFKKMYDVTPSAYREKNKKV